MSLTTPFVGALHHTPIQRRSTDRAEYCNGVFLPVSFHLEGTLDLYLEFVGLQAGDQSRRKGPSRSFHILSVRVPENLLSTGVLKVCLLYTSDAADE